MGEYIGSVEFEGQRIEFSPRMNAIIGGRGSGKSVLLDSIACSINADAGELRQERKDFVTSRKTTAYTLSGVPILRGQFGFDYFNQSYIASIFEKTGKDFNEAVEKYFASAFEVVGHIDRSAIERANEKCFSDCLQTFEEITPENIFHLLKVINLLIEYLGILSSANALAGRSTPLSAGSGAQACPDGQIHRPFGWFGVAGMPWRADQRLFGRFGGAGMP